VTAQSSFGQLLMTVPLSSKKGKAHGWTLALGRELVSGSRHSSGLQRRARGVEEHGAGTQIEMGDTTSSYENANFASALSYIRSQGRCMWHRRKTTASERWAAQHGLQTAGWRWSVTRGQNAKPGTRCWICLGGPWARPNRVALSQFQMDQAW
jgi:hypothetical protein